MIKKIFFKIKGLRKIALCLAAVLLFGLCFPKIIDLLFLISGNSITELTQIKPSDLLTFWGSLLVLGSTVILALVTLEQNDRLMKLEESKLQPFIIVDGSEFIVEGFRKIPISEYQIDNIRFHYTNPNIEISFWVRNISDFYISKIALSKISIVGYAIHPKIEPGVLLESENQVFSAIDKALIPDGKKRITICFENRTNLLYYDLYVFSLTCELSHIAGEGITSQILNFQVGNNDKKLSIIGTGTFNPNKNLMS
jgi:hypothetical protein